MGKLIAAAGLGALYAAFAMLGSVITAVTGVPAVSGGMIISVLGGMVLSFCCLSIGLFGYASFAGLIYGILALSFPAMGPPGFLPKVLIGLAGGFVADLCWILLRRWRLAGSLIAGGASQGVIGGLIIVMGLIFRIPGIEKAVKMKWLAVGGGFVLGAIGGFLAFIVFQNLKNTKVIQRLNS